MNRRKFLSTATTGAAILTAPLTSISEKMKTNTAPDFQLLILATNWGFPGTHDEFCAKARAAG